MARCIVCGEEKLLFHQCPGPKDDGKLKKKRGFFASLSLAFDIVAGSFRLLWLYPMLVVPLLPVFLMVLGLEFVL